MYLWLVLLHIAGVVVFLFGHGSSALISFRLRDLRDAAGVAEHLRDSHAANRLSWIGLVLTLIGGFGAAIVGGQLGSAWVLGSIVVLAVVFVVMFAVGASYYYGLRDALEKVEKGEAPGFSESELVARLHTRRPEILAAVGGIGLVVILYLMVMKPG